MDNLCPYVALQRNKTGGLCRLLSSSDFDSGGKRSYLSGAQDCEHTVLEGGRGHGRREMSLEDSLGPQERDMSGSRRSEWGGGNW